MVLLIWATLSLLTAVFSNINCETKITNATGKEEVDKQQCWGTMYSGLPLKCYNDQDLTHILKMICSISLSSKEMEPLRHHCLLELAGFGMEDLGFSCQSAYIRINGEALDIVSFVLERSSETICRAIHLITLEFHNDMCIVGMNMSYDTYRSKEAAAALNDQLKAFPTGTVIAAVTSDEFTLQLETATETLDKQYGVRLKAPGKYQSMWFRSSAAWVAVKGDPSRACVKQLPAKLGPAKITVNWI